MKQKSEMTGNEKPGIEQLHQPENFQLVKKLGHNEIAEFVIGELKHVRWPMLVFYILSAVLLLMIVAITTANIISNFMSWQSFLGGLVAGTGAGVLLVIPFHEGLHGLAYRLAGARKIKYGMDLRQMIFYASAPGFVAGRYDFMLVALLPFIIINFIFISGIIWGQPFIQWTSLVAFFMHSTMCIGDFAMLNFMASYHGKRIYTYDDARSKVSYFYVSR